MHRKKRLIGEEWQRIHIEELIADKKVELAQYLIDPYNRKAYLCISLHDEWR